MTTPTTPTPEGESTHAMGAAPPGRTYTDAQVARERAENRRIEAEWRDRVDRGLPPSGRAEQSWRMEHGRR